MQTIDTRSGDEAAERSRADRWRRPGRPRDRHRPRPPRRPVDPRRAPPDDLDLPAGDRRQHALDGDLPGLGPRRGRPARRLAGDPADGGRQAASTTARRWRRRSGFPSEDDTRPVSPTTAAVSPQDHLEPVLLDHYRELGGEAWFSTELVSFAQDCRRRARDDPRPRHRGVADDPRRLPRRRRRPSQRGPGPARDRDAGPAGSRPVLQHAVPGRPLRRPRRDAATGCTRSTGDGPPRVLVPSGTDDRYVLAIPLPPGVDEADGRGDVPARAVRRADPRGHRPAGARRRAPRDEPRSRSRPRSRALARRAGLPRRRRRPPDDAARRPRDEHRDRRRVRPRRGSSRSWPAASPIRRCSTRTRPSAGRSAGATSRCRWCRRAAARTTAWPRTSGRSSRRRRSRSRPTAAPGRGRRTPGSTWTARAISTLDLFGRGLVLLAAGSGGGVADGGRLRSRVDAPGLSLAVRSRRAATADPDGTFAAAYGLEDGGAVTGPARRRSSPGGRSIAGRSGAPRWRPQSHRAGSQRGSDRSPKERRLR